MKLLILAPFPYHSKVTHGGGVVCFQQLDMLAREHEVHFLSFIVREDAAEVAFAKADLATRCASVDMVQLDLRRPVVWRAMLGFLTRLLPVDASLFQSEEMHRLLRRSMAQIQPDLVLLQFPQMAQYVADCAAAATVLDVQDAFSVSGFRRYRAETAPLRRLRQFFNWTAWLFYEMRHYQRFDAVATLTEQDRVALEVFSPGLGADVIPAAVGLPAQLWQPSALASETLCFLGSFSHFPNVEGLRYFIEAVLPLIMARRPGVRLLVAGAKAPPRLFALASPHVEFLGFVPDAEAFMRAASVTVVPLLSGGGIKTKTLEAMACGCPIVSTSIGVEETGVRHGEHALISNDATQFAEHVLALLEDEELAVKLGAQARQLVTEKFSWRSKKLAFAHVFDRACYRRRLRKD